MLFTACTRAEDSKPQPVPPPREHVAPAVARVSDAPITLALDAPAPSTFAGPSTGRFGVRWRAEIPGADPELIAGALVIGSEVFVSTPTEIQVFDLATGAKLRSATLEHTRLVATHDALVMTSNQEERGLDKQTLRPTWHAPAPNFLAALGDYVLETPLLTEPQVLRLRRASDGHVMWQNHEQLFASGTAAVIDGDALYVRAYVGADARNVAALDVATGTVRWRTEGYLASASGGHVVIQDLHDPPPSYRILDAAGHVRWRSSGAWLWVDGDIAYASTSSSITALELTTNRVRWRRTDASALESDDRWLYGTTEHGTLQITDRTTGELAGTLELGYPSWGNLFHGSPVVRIGKWLFALGPLASPEPRKPIVARGCLVVMGCCGGSPFAGAKVTIDGTTTATTDRHGCFQARASLGLGPARIDVVDAHGDPPKLDNDFPRAAVFDGSQLTLSGLYIGGGCHDAQCPRR